MAGQIRFYPFARPSVDFHHDAQRDHPQLQAPVADAPLPEMHALAVIRLGLFYYAACSCRGWVSEAQDTIHRAQSIEACPYEALDVEGRRNLAAFRRAAVAEAQLDRLYPKLTKQVGWR